MAEQLLRNNLKIFRAKHNLTQEALADKVGVSRKTINVIEAGGYSPSISLVLTIAETLRVNVEELFYME